MIDSVPVRDAATVILLRDSSQGIQTWLLSRVAQMSFAAGMTVFPGGRVEPADAQLGQQADDMARRFGCTQEFARALVGAAARETFEEAGVLLTSPPLHLGAELSADVEAGRIIFADVLREQCVSIDESLLRPWGRWITPEGEVRRYDTYFFVAALPAGAHAENRTTESCKASWVSVYQALREAACGERLMLPPTRLTLRSLRDYDTVAQVLQAADERDLSPILPVFHTDPQTQQLSVQLPDGTRYAIPTGP